MMQLVYTCHHKPVANSSTCDVAPSSRMFVTMLRIIIYETATALRLLRQNDDAFMLACRLMDINDACCQYTETIQLNQIQSFIYSDFNQWGMKT